MRITSNCFVYNIANNPERKSDQTPAARSSIFLGRNNCGNKPQQIQQMIKNPEALKMEMRWGDFWRWTCLPSGFGLPHMWVRLHRGGNTRLQVKTECSVLHFSLSFDDVVGSLSCKAMHYWRYLILNHVKTSAVWSGKPSVFSKEPVNIEQW